MTEHAQSLNWNDLYSGESTIIDVDPNNVPTVDSPDGLPTMGWAGPSGQVVELDDGGKAILSMIAEDFRAAAEVQLRPMFAAIRAGVTADVYAMMCSDMVRAAKAYHAGDAETAFDIMGNYVPREMLEGMSGVTA